MSSMIECPICGGWEHTPDCTERNHGAQRSPKEWTLSEHGDGGICALGPVLEADEQIHVIEKSAYDEMKERAFEFETKYNRLRQINREYVDEAWRKQLAEAHAEIERLKNQISLQGVKNE